MISGTPDKTLGLEKLFREIRAFRWEINQKWNWYLYESYIDRATLDPYYIFQFRADVQDKRDALYDQKLFITRHSAIKGVCMTRTSTIHKNYWVKIPRIELLSRLDHFWKMYVENFLQPPGSRSYSQYTTVMHEKIKNKRFLFEIRSDSRGIIGIGSQMFANFNVIGALYGQVFDLAGKPIEDDIEVRLYSDSMVRTRKTKTGRGGLFWFSKVPEGEYSIQIDRAQCYVHVIRREPFGNVKGWLTDQNGRPLAENEVRLIAPDEEKFSAWTDATGKFTSGPVPAFEYGVDVTDHPPTIAEKIFYAKKEVIVGYIQDQKNNPLAGQKILLMKGEAVFKEATSDHRGHFHFTDVPLGPYSILVKGKPFSLQEPSGQDLKGGEKSFALKLVVYDYYADDERTDQYKYLFKKKDPVDVL